MALSKKLPLESNYQKRLVKKIRKMFPMCYLFVKEAKAIRGIPDLILTVNGRFIGLEVKRCESESKHRTGRTVLQRHNINKINRAGGYACFIYPENEEEVIEAISLISQSSSL